MTRPYLSHSIPFIRWVCLILCYSLVTPFLVFIPKPPIVIANTATPIEPIKPNIPHTATQTTQKARWRDGEILIRFQQNIAQSEIDALLQSKGAERNGRLRGQSGIERLRLTVNLDPSAVATALRASQLVDFAEPNYLIAADQIDPNDPRFSEQWALKNTSNNSVQFGSDINALQGWRMTTGSKRTVIAVLDSGVDFTHPDLRSNEWNNPLERNDNNLDDDNNGFIDDVHGWDFVADSNEIKDEQGHGTMVAGIIAARGNNATGITGVMWRAGLMSLRVLDKTGTGDVAGAVEAIDYAVTDGAQVINCSWGTDDASVALLEAINRASHRGVVVVTSAGNNSRDIETSPRYPASFDLNNLVTVASTDSSDLLASWSNRGARHVAVAAPGSDILTTKMGGDYQVVSGSSFSAPFVTGVAGLIKTLRPWLGSERTREMILRGARRVPNLHDKVASGGVVNAASALGTLNTLPPNGGLDASGGNNGGNHGNAGYGRSNQRDDENANRGRDGKEFTVTPPERTQGVPGLTLPNLDELRRKQPVAPKAPAPIPSTRCSHKDPDCTSRKHQAAIESPVEMIAWGLSLTPVESSFADNSSSISDSPFRLFGSSNSSIATLVPQPQINRTNVALASSGAIASASSSYQGNYPASAVNNGDRRGLNWSSGGGWHDATENVFPDWVQIDFNGAKTINEVNVFSPQDSWQSPSVPTETMTFTLYGVAGFNVQYWTGYSWATVPNGSITGNNLVWRRITFPDVTTSKIRVSVNNGLQGYSRIAEVEAWGTAARTNVALSTNGATVSASSQHDSNLWPASDTIDGDRKGGSAGWWNDNTQYVYPDWLQIAFQGNKTIDEISVFTVQDNYQNPSEPTPSMTFSNYGLTAFDVQYWNGTNWVTVPNGSVSGNNLVWRKFTFSPITTDKVRVLINNSLLYYSRITEIEAWGTASDPSGDNYSKARLEPSNRTGQSGVDLLSGNANWSLPLLSLKGRAGLDLGLVLSYNSLVWTKDTSSNSIKFDADQGMASPGFRLGFPVIQPRYYNSQVGKHSYLLLTPSGSRVELRQVGTSNIYESADSSYLQLIDSGGGSLTLRPTDGSQLSYSLKGGQYQCVEIKDRNGNYITINYDPINNIANTGHPTSIVDTLGRTINFVYDGNLNLSKITQTRTVNGQPQLHDLATFGWDNLTINTSFTGMTIMGPQNGTLIPVVIQVGLPDGTRYNFDYTSWGQVYKIRHYAQDGHLLNWVGYNLPGSEWLATSAQSDCPRFTEQKVWAENWNNLNNVPAVVVTQYSIASVSDGSSGQATLPDGTIYKELYATTGWQKGLATTTENWSATENGSAGVKKKWTTLSWTQDDTNIQYQKNPRVTETNIYDQEENRKRTTINYGTYAGYGLPYQVDEYAADGSTILRSTYTDYNLSQSYLDSRIIGLVSAVEVKVSQALQSKVTYAYDAGGIQLVATDQNTIQHDASYGAGSTPKRGLLTSVTRHSVTDASSVAVTQIGYDTNGSVVFTKDPLNHQVGISYLDSFSDNLNRNTFAYPTAVTDAAGNNSTSKFDYHLGAVTRTQGPPPAGHTEGATQTFEYDAAGRIIRVNNLVNDAYKRWVYDAYGAIITYTTIQTGLPETFQVTYSDGMGRVIAQGGDLPNSTGLYWGQYTFYDQMGRAAQSSNPVEMTGSWIPAGDDAAGWTWTYQQYDWKGRPTLTTNPDGTTKEATYGGCGCAGGEVVTIRDEVGRRQRVTSDVLGRNVKTEVLNWDQSVYSTVINTFNARDQITSTIELAASGGATQTTEFAYDGHGRLKSRQAPSQTAATQYVYNADDTVQSMTDARGVVSTFSYNNRRLLTNITYSEPAGIAATSPVTYTYDAVGNRTSMAYGSGSVNYAYDRLSRLTSESRQFSGLSGTFPLSYSYNLAGELTSITDPTGAIVNYSYDQTGRMTDVTGSGYSSITSYASNLRYRAWGGMKSMTYGNGYTLAIGYNSRLHLASFDLTGYIPQYGSMPAISSQYQYHADGSLRSARDMLDERMDRAYVYDHVGRLQEAYTGSEARDYLNQTQSGTVTGPYRQSYQYNVWGEMTARTNRYWSQQTNYTASYLNGRNQNPAWQYDAMGHVLSDDSVQYTWDAAGHTREVRSLSSTRTIVQEHDGTGQTVKRVETNPAETTYYLRSSVLGGRVVTQLNASGQKVKGYVYAGAEVIAEQENNTVKWKHVNPLTGSQSESDTNGGYVITVESDPIGVNVGTEDPLVDPEPVGFIPESETPMIGGLGWGGGCSSLDPNCRKCFVDGFEMNCEQVAFMESVGSAERQAPLMMWGNGRWNFVRFNPDTGQYGYWRTRMWNVEGTTAGYDPVTGEEFEVSSGYTTNTWVSVQSGGSRGLDFFSYGWRSQTPQNPERRLTPYEVQKLSGRVQQLLTQKCKDFIKQLINKAAEQTPSNPAHDTDVMKLFNKIQSQKGFIYRSGWGTIGGYIHNKDARVYLGGYQPFRSVVNQLDEAHTAIHEIIHQAGKYWYGDKAMARAIIAIRQEQGLSVNKTQDEIEYMLRPTTPLGFASDFWDVYLREACGSRR